MPKKSNKTDHVLNLLTGGLREENPESSSKANQAPTAESQDEKHSSTSPISVPLQQIHSFTAQYREPAPLSQPSSRVVIEESGKRDALSNLVKLGLEEELRDMTKAREERKTFFPPEIDILKNSEVPSSQNFSSEDITEVYSEDEMDFVTSTPFILENFNEDEEQIMSTENPNQNLCTEASENPEALLHNLAEDVMKAKAPAIMESMNMCTCQACVYDVIALALNNTKPLYTVTKKGELFQKLATCEMQYGSDITREITRACLKIKLNPRHEAPSEE